MKQTSLVPMDAFGCIDSLGAALARSLYACGHAAQEQFDFMAKVVNHFYDAPRAYQRLREEGGHDDTCVQSGVDCVRQGVALIDSKDGKAFAEGLPVPSRVILEAILLFAATYLDIYEAKTV